MRKVAVFLRSHYNNSVRLRCISIDQDYAVARYGSTRNYIKFLFAKCDNVNVEYFKLFDSATIDL